jgi:hypothetical protein
LRLQLELGQAPATFGLEGKKWQGKLLRTHLAKRYQIDFSLRQCQRLLKQYRQSPADPDTRPRRQDMATFRLSDTPERSRI